MSLKVCDYQRVLDSKFSVTAMKDYWRSRVVTSRALYKS